MSYRLALPVSRLALLLFAPVLFALSCAPKPETVHESSSADYELMAGDRPSPEAPVKSWSEHFDELTTLLPHENFTIVRVGRFAVVGDEAPQVVRSRAARTVKWAVDHLTARYFDHEPSRFLNVWLFKDEESYRKHARELYGDDPSTPFGYYSSSDDALVMNISTGGGTFVHELVHPHIEADFPHCPAWFNEGLASLYEQSAERNGTIWGLTNWRLAGLKDAIRAESLPSFAELFAQSPGTFYGDNSGVHYAQARYLCYWLQERGFLVDFYRKFRDAGETDPTGLLSLRSVIGRSDVEAFQKEWEAFCLRLAYR